jgi:hypothetical protein
MADATIELVRLERAPRKTQVPTRWTATFEVRWEDSSFEVPVHLSGGSSEENVVGEARARLHAILQALESAARPKPAQ